MRHHRNEAVGSHIGRWLRAAGILFLLLAGIIEGSAQVPEDFGYNRIAASGGRPLLIILTEFAGSPPLRNNAAAYFDHLAFNLFAPASDPSLMTYFAENSNGRFYWVRAGLGVAGPYQFRQEDVDPDDDGKLSRITLALKAADKDGFDFDQFDENGDGSVTTDELGILVIDNLLMPDSSQSTGAANRASDPLCFKPDGSQVNLCLRAALAGHRASFMSMAHELLHSVGIPAQGDIYGSNDNNQGYSTMGATIYGTLDDMRTYHLDPFHKMQLGWVEPRLYSIQTPRSVDIGAAQLVVDDQPVLLYSPYDFHDFFMLEYRTTVIEGGAGYDANLPSNGLLVWHIKLDDNKVPVITPSLKSPVETDPAVFMLGAPNMARGHGTAWTGADSSILGSSSRIIPYPLTWLSGVATNVRIKVGKMSANGSKLNVAWGDFTEEPLPPRKKILYYSRMDQTGAVGQFDDQGNHRTVDTFNPGNTSWTNLVDTPAGIFYYDRQTGAAMLGSVDIAGKHTIVKLFPQGSFGAGWTHIVSHRGYLFFYASSNGMAAIGSLSINGFRQYKSYPANSFGLGWTHIISTQAGLFFYSSANGAGAVGAWEYSYLPCSGFCFPTVSEVRFKQLAGYGPGSFTTGWTSIAETTNGVLFYRASDGVQVMADIEASGAVTTRTYTVKYLKPGYTSIVAAGNDILLYNAASGDGARAEIVKPDPWVVAVRVGSLQIRQEFPAYFSPGWSHVVTTADPTLIH